MTLSDVPRENAREKPGENPAHTGIGNKGRKCKMLSDVPPV